MRHVEEFEAEQGGGSFFAHLPTVFWQRRWFAIVPTILLSIGGVVAAFLMPVHYTSTATLLVQSAALPQAIAGGNPDDVVERRIARIREQVLSRPELIELVNRYQLYPRERARAELSSIVDTMRSAASIAPLGAEMGGGNGQTIAFTLSYSYSDPVKAQAVAQDLSEQVLQLDATRSTQQADATVQFLADQAHSLQQQMTEQESKIAAIKLANGKVLSSAGGSTVMSGTGSYDVQIAALQRENAIILAQRDQAQSGDTRNPIVAQAEATLAAMQAVYSDDHPDVKAAKQRLLEAKAVARKSTTNSPNLMVEQQLAFNNRQIASLRAAQGAEIARVNSTANAQSRAPLVMQEIAQLQQKLDWLSEQYKGASDRLLQAKAGVKAENEQLGQRLSIVDPPVVPTEPSGPKRWMLMAGGPFAGLALGLVLALAVEMLLRPIRDPAALTPLFGEAPLGVIPTIAVKATKPKRRWFGLRKAKTMEIQA